MAGKPQRPRRRKSPLSARRGRKKCFFQSRGRRGRASRSEPLGRYPSRGERLARCPALHAVGKGKLALCGAPHLLVTGALAITSLRREMSMRIALSPKVALLALTVFPSHHARADSGESGAAYLSGCKSVIAGDSRPGVRAIDTGRCLGSIAAIMALGKELPGSARFCSPPHASVLQGAMIAVQYLEGTPQAIHERFVVLVIDAFRTAWPCKKSGQPGQR